MNNIEEDTKNMDIFNNQDLENLNTNVWFNKIETRLQYCLTKDDVQDGFAQYKMLIAHAEIIAISGGKMNEEEYKKEFEEIKNKSNLKGEESVKQMKESMIKYKIILRHLLKTKKSDLNLNFS